MGTIRLKSSSQYLNVVNDNRWVTRTVTYSKIDGDSVLDYAEMNSGINRGQLAAAMHAVVQSFKNFLLNGHSVELPEVGIFRFSVSAYAREDVEDAGADAVRVRRVLFTPSTRLKSEIAAVSLTSSDSDSDSDSDD